MPLDSRQVVETLDDLLALDENIIYDGMKCYVHEKDAEYKFNSTYNETDTGNWKKISSDTEAENVKFSDGENLQQKLDDGSLGGSGTIDSELSMTSENPVKNSVITKAVNERRREYILSTAVSNTYVVVPLRYQETSMNSHYVTLADETGDLIIVCGSGKLGTLKAFRVNPDVEPNITNLYCLTSSTYLTSTLYVQRKNSSSSITITGSHSPSFLRYEPSDRGEEIPIENLGGDSSITLTQDEYDALTDEEKNNGKEYRTYDTGHIYKLGVEYGKDACFTSLSQLGLTADATFQDVIDKLPKGGSALLGVKDFTNYQTIFPYAEGKDQFARVYIVKGIADGSSMYARWFRKDGIKEAIAKFNIETNKFDGWRMLKNQQTYTSLAELGLDTTATINDIIDAMEDGTQFTYKTDVFDYATEYNNIQYGTVTIYKQSAGRTQVLMTDKNTGNLYVGRMDTSNRIVGWRNEAFHRIVTQATAGYFKFKPTSDGGFNQPLRISVTDNYGGMINISGAKPTASQYKPFKCIRLSYGEYSNYDAMKIANNKMLKLFYYDGYFYLKVTTYTTCTFTGLVEAPTYVETFDETDAEEIPIRSVFDTPYNDGYADPSIISIGDVDSADGVIKTLTTLGFTGDVMTWNTGEYRISHVAGLTNLPTEITEEKPGFRLAHYDVKKWGNNHNPYSSTYGCRQSVLHYKGNIFVRYTESGANAGVLITDTGWRKINTNNSTTLVTNTANLKLDVTKKNTAWYGAIKLTYLYDTSPVEVEIDFRNATDTLKWTISKGQKYIKKITYTQDSSNKAHYTIGIEFSGTTYGCYQAEVIGGFADINSLTADAFTGDTTAVYGNPYGKNNGVTLVSAPEDLGLTSPCTTVQLAQAMRNTFNKTITSGAIGVFDNGGNTITDAPSDYGLLHIEVFGYDRIMIRYDGIGSSSYNGSWTGQVVGGNGTFSSVNWSEDSNSFNSKSVKTVTIDLSASDLQSTGTSTTQIDLSNYISPDINVIKIEGYYLPPSDCPSLYKGKKYIVYTYSSDQFGAIRHNGSKWVMNIAQSSSGSNKGSGFVKVYYVE